MEPELKTYLAEINQHLAKIQTKNDRGIWRSFFNGMFSAFGYLAGLAFIVVILSWVLNRMGLWDNFKQQISEYQSFFSQAKQVMNISQTGQGSAQTKGNETTITMPDGKQYKITQ